MLPCAPMVELIAFPIFVVSIAATPGPVNLVALSSGLNFDYRSTVKFILGAATGFSSMVLALGLGIIEVVQRFPKVLFYLSFFGAAFIIYLGFKIIRSNPYLEFRERNRPTYMDALLMQWLNPKTWMASISMVSIFTLTDSYGKLVSCAGLTFVLTFPSVSLWAFSGEKMRSLFRKPEWIKYLNYAMGSCLILVAVMLTLLQKDFGIMVSN